jgi:hypothetical protein
MCVLLAAALLAPGLGGAQVALGSDCRALDASPQQIITLSRAVPAQSLIVVSVVVNDVFTALATSNPVSDNRSNGYALYDSAILSNLTGILLTFAGRATQALNVGDSIGVAYSTVGSASTQGCAVATAFPAVLMLDDPSDATGENSGNGTDWRVTSYATQYANDLVYSAFASAGAPGSIVALAPAQGIGGACSGDNSLCLLPAWNLGASMAGIQEGADAQSGNSTNWGALLITFQSNDRIFADGFE